MYHDNKDMNESVSSWEFKQKLNEVENKLNHDNYMKSCVIQFSEF